MAQYQTHGNGNGLDDLYILPEMVGEKEKIVKYLRRIGWGFTFWISDVRGQDWFLRQVIDIPFGEFLREEIERKIAKC